MAIPLVILGYFVCFTSILVVAVFILLQLAATATVACVIAFKRNRCVANGCLCVCVCVSQVHACTVVNHVRRTCVLVARGVIFILFTSRSQCIPHIPLLCIYLSLFLFCLFLLFVRKSKQHLFASIREYNAYVWLML